jgi:hypothetical protein
LKQVIYPLVELEHGELRVCNFAEQGHLKHQVLRNVGTRLPNL